MAKSTANTRTVAAAESAPEPELEVADVEQMAYQGEPIPTGWSYNPRRGFYKSEVEVESLQPIDPVLPNNTGADAPSDPSSGDGV